MQYAPVAMEAYSAVEFVVHPNLSFDVYSVVALPPPGSLPIEASETDEKSSSLSHSEHNIVAHDAALLWDNIDFVMMAREDSEDLKVEIMTDEVEGCNSGSVMKNNGYFDAKDGTDCFILKQRLPSNQVWDSNMVPASNVIDKELVNYEGNPKSSLALPLGDHINLETESEWHVNEVCGPSLEIYVIIDMCL